MPVLLNNKAYKIMAGEIAKAANKDQFAGEVSQKIALKRLNKLNSLKGEPLTEKELTYLINDVFPDFDPKIISKAIRANRPASSLWLIPKVLLGLGGLSGLIWVLNLPFPMIRRPVARTAPIILLPSYIKMDRHYRAAIALTEQADQLVNQATSLADLKLGEGKVTQAQYNLDALPVWFLGYEPQMSGGWFNFGWKFTLDEFESARKAIGRMEAKIFQEINALNQLEQAQQDITLAQQNYQQAQDITSKEIAIKAWQAGIDQLNQLPNNTLAQEQANPKYEAYLRDFRQISNTVAENNRTSKIIAVAQQFYTQATNSCTNTVNPNNLWQECINLLNKAIAILNQVSLDDSGYLETQTLLANYEAKLGQMRIFQQQEQESQQAYELAQSMIANLPNTVDSSQRNTTTQAILNIINQLEKVHQQTTVYQDALALKNLADKKLQQLK
ncbi:hypothetical protein NIES4102_11710 [Chondrocystis sp. NIES-4102]|nr:hypothetical protein NIES4102_11710 [Chondrocystis sp. NIES-4102]